MILNDNSIHERAKRGMIEPYNVNRCGPSSYDLRLGRSFSRNLVHVEIDTAQDDVSTEDWEADSVLLRPGDTILATTMETVRIPRDIQAQVTGRSSLGRLFVQVHQTAGLLDPGFVGEVTLELKNVGINPVRLHAGDRVCQVTFYELNEPAARPYDRRDESQYKNQEGATSSGMSFR